MSVTIGPLVLALSSRALFNLDASHRVYQEQGASIFAEYQVEHENEPLQPGEALALASKLNRLDQRLGGGRIELVLLSRNSPDSGQRVMNSIEHHGLQIARAVFCGGSSPYRYAAANGCHLFLSMNTDDVRGALREGTAAATMLNAGSATSGVDEELRFAFDGDAVLFSDEAEQIYQRQGLEQFNNSERSATEPLGAGPFKPFIEALHGLQVNGGDDCPIRTALVTARSPQTSRRIVETLRAWDIRLDESVFLSGAEKGAFIRAFGADIYFDDQMQHCESARRSTATGHVPNGILNE